MDAIDPPDAAAAQRLLTTTLSQLGDDEVRQRRLVHATLHVIGGQTQGQHYAVPYPRAFAGRSEHADIPLMDASISAAHFELVFAEHSVKLRDLGSRNGTWVGRGRIRGDVELHDGAEFHAGTCGLRIEFGDEQDRPVTTSDAFHGMRATSVRMRELFALLRRVAPLPLSVLIHGETGTGKEEVARALHAASGRAGPFEVLDCSTIPRELAESTILGHRKGAFTGATADHRGAFERAEGGTLLLDEVGELPAELQPKLLRVLDRREVQRVGDADVRAVDVRVLAATHRDLRLDVASGRFRADLFHRLVQLSVPLPPLREHSEDIEVLARHFLRPVALALSRPFELSAAAVDKLAAQHWPGNVRELKAVIERSAYLAQASSLGTGDLVLDAAGSSTAEDASLFELPLKQALERVQDRFARDYCQRSITRHAGDLDEVATSMGYSRKGLRELMRRVGLRDD